MVMTHSERYYVQLCYICAIALASAKQGEIVVVITDEMIETYQRDGVVLIKGLWVDWVEELRAGVARNMAEPGPYGAENLKPGEGGRFFEDYCN